MNATAAAARPTVHTLADVFRPATRSGARSYDLILVLIGSLFVALCAQLEIRNGFVPFTGQTFGVLLVGALLGARRGAAALVAYLVEGAAGAPVFAGGAFGFVHLLGPTGGFLISFVPAAFLTGFLAERGWDRRVLSTVLMMMLSTALIFAIGLPWLAVVVGPRLAFTGAMLPFIPAALIKIALAAALLPVGWRLLGRASDQR